VRLWDPKTGALIRILRGHDHSGVFKIIFSPNSKLLASVTYGDIFLWDLATANQLHKLQGGPKNFKGAMAFSPDSKLLAFSIDGILLNIATGTLLQSPDAYINSVSAVAFSPDGKILASTSFKILRL
jgi:WD40 repeat protein